MPYDIPTFLWGLHFILVLILRQFHYVIHAGPNAKMMGATTPGSVHFFCAQRIESTVAQLPQQRSRVDRDDITEMTSGGSSTALEEGTFLLGSLWIPLGRTGSTILRQG